MPQIQDSDYPAGPSDENGAPEEERGRFAGSFVDDDIVFDDDDDDGIDDGDDDIDDADDGIDDADDDDGTDDSSADDFDDDDKYDDDADEYDDDADDDTDDDEEDADDYDDDTDDDDTDDDDESSDYLRPILSVILDALDDNGCLPDDFQLPVDPDDDDPGFQFVDGGMDGILIYHTDFKDPGDAARESAHAFLSAAARHDFSGAFNLLGDLSDSTPAITMRNAMQDELEELTDDDAAQNVFEFALNILCYGNEREMVKYALEILEGYDLPGTVRDMVRTVALSDEFTLYALYIMVNWDDSNDEIFDIAQRVHGWGRIHCVVALEPDTDEIRAWLLHEGWHNTITASYCAKECFEKSGAADMLRMGHLTDEEFADISSLLLVLIDEGPEPVPGISEIDDADEIIDDFLRVASERSRDRDLTDEEREAVRFATAYRSGNLDDLDDEDYGEETGNFEVVEYDDRDGSDDDLDDDFDDDSDDGFDDDASDDGEDAA